MFALGEEVKKIMKIQGVSLAVLAEEIGKRTGKTQSAAGVNYKVRNGSVPLVELMVICDILGYEIGVTPKHDVLHLNIRELITEMRTTRNMKFVELHKKFNEQSERPLAYSGFSKTITNNTLRAKDFQLICDILGYDFYIKQKGESTPFHIADITKGEEYLSMTTGETGIMRNRVKELRVARGVSQRKLAEIITNEYDVPTSFGTISRLELQQEDNPKWKSISAMATYFCVTTDYLMGKTDENFYFDQIKGDGDFPQN